jgi:adenylate cyclase
MQLMSLFAELKRRNVVRVGIAYVVLAWVIAQVAEFAFEIFGAPAWVLKSLVVVLLLGLPLVLLFAWAFELTPEGLKREKDVDRSKSITPQTGRKLDRAIIGILLVALAWFAWDRFLSGSETGPDAAATVAASEAAVAGDEGPALAAEKSVAVLPFIAMSSGPDDAYFADGLTEEILNSLAQLPELLVTARTSAFSFKGEDLPVQEIAAVLGVRHIVEGSVRRSGDRLRVTAQLIRANDGFHVWSENYDSSSTDTIAVQENIAEKIASAMDIVLDEGKRAAMRRAGLRDVEAFTIYQKGLEAYNHAHGETDTVEGLRQANVFFDQVIERVPGFSQAYIDHSDFYIHKLSDDASGFNENALSKEERATTYAAAIADYESAERNAQTTTMRLMTEADLAFISGNWRGLGAKVERALHEPGCDDGNWTQIIAEAFGYVKQYLERSYQILTCDPRRSLSWFNTARAALRTGDRDEALRVAREGMDVAEGNWLHVALVRAMIANGLYAEARKAIDERVLNVEIALAFSGLVAAHEGDRESFDRTFEQFQAEYSSDYYWTIIVAAWGGDRDIANRAAAKIDEHPFGAVTLSQVAVWCGCGAPWDLDATPNFAAKLEEGSLDWPPRESMEFPLKDW